MTTQPLLTAIILTYNEAQHIADCIASISWADHILVFDSFSTDETGAIAAAAGAEVRQHPFQNFGAQRDAALKVVKTSWVLFVDADERVTDELHIEIRRVLDSPESDRLRGWWIPRHNYIFGKLTLGAGWYPDHQLRLLHRNSARYDPRRPVHEEVLLDGQAGYLSHPLLHYNYASVDQFHRKQRKYIQFEAQLRYDAGERARLHRYITLPIRQFIWRFVTLKGYRDGFHGFRLSLFMAYYEFVTWRLIAGLGQSTGSV